MKVFLTENNGFVGPRIEAFDAGHARQLAIELGVTVTGEHFLTLSRKGFTEAEADKLCKALAESVF